MAHIDINLDAVESGGGVHKAGMTLWRIIKGEVKQNKNGDGFHIRWLLKPLEDENKSNGFLRHSLKPEAQWNLKSFLEAVGFGPPGSDKSKQWSADGSFNTDDAVGCDVWITNNPEEYEGDMRDQLGSPYKAAS